MSRAVCERCPARLAHITCRSTIFAPLTAFRQTALCGQFRAISNVWLLRPYNRIALVNAVINRALALDNRMLLPSLRSNPKMPSLTLVFVFIVVGVGLWLVNSYLPMASSIKTILNVVVVVGVGVFVLKSAGLWSQVTSFRIGH